MSNITPSLNNTPNLIQDYKTVFNPYKQKHIKKYNPKGKWYTCNRPLTDELMLKTIQGQMTRGMFASYTTDVLGFDIDNHDKNSNLFIKDIDVLRKYNYLIKHFGVPNLVFRSSHSRGLHCYYLFDQKFPFLIFKYALDNKLKLPKGIEQKPTPNIGIRLPQATQEGGIQLDNITLEPVKESELTSNLHEANTTGRKSFYDVFKQEPSRILFSANTRKQQLRNYNKLTKLHTVMKSIFPIVQGTKSRNEKLQKFARACFYSGIGIPEAANIILSNMQDHTGCNYDYQESRVVSQLKSYYKLFSKDKNKKSIEYQSHIVRHGVQLNFLQEKEIDKLVKSSSFSVRRKKGYKKFLSEMYNWKRYIQTMSKENIAYYNYLYPYFRHNTVNRALIPLPKNLLHGWNERFNEFLAYLKSIKIIELRQNYSTDLGVCNYFNIKELY